MRLREFFATEGPKWIVAATTAVTIAVASYFIAQAYSTKLLDLQLKRFDEQAAQLAKLQLKLDQLETNRVTLKTAFETTESLFTDAQGKVADFDALERQMRDDLGKLQKRIDELLAVLDGANSRSPQEIAELVATINKAGDAAKLIETANGAMKIAQTAQAEFSTFLKASNLKPIQAGQLVRFVAHWSHVCRDNGKDFGSTWPWQLTGGSAKTPIVPDPGWN